MGLNLAPLPTHRAHSLSMSWPQSLRPFQAHSQASMSSSQPGVRRYRPNPKLVRAMDIMFTLHAEHEMNCSTAAARHLSSSGVDVYTAIGGAGLFI